ncbi:MAG: sugar phosphate nucleotidyltransferase [Candidatus Pacebacteria bacterium]|nr:sugar phosphate nucleotidyltransferase [Candidatus Paceibacterota bacterium]
MMKVVIAAAGQGTRMKHLCKNKPKSLICVKQRPFLAYLLDNLIEAGYKDFILVIGYYPDLMERFVKEYLGFCKKNQKGNIKISLVDQFKILGPKEKEYGTLCPLKCVKDLVGQENFLSIYGDNLFSVRDLKAMGAEDSYNYIGASTSDCPEKYGVLIIDKQGHLKEIIEKPKEYVGNLVNKGIYKFTSDIFDKISQVKISPRGEYELTDAVTLLAKEGKVKVQILQDYWMDFGNPGDVLKVSKFLSNKKSSA